MKLICDKCKREYAVSDSERKTIPEKYTVLRCNFCPECSPNRNPFEYQERDGVLHKKRKHGCDEQDN